jgi:hypothetical protein
VRHPDGRHHLAAVPIESRNHAAAIVSATFPANGEIADPVAGRPYRDDGADHAGGCSLRGAVRSGWVGAAAHAQPEGDACHQSNEPKRAHVPCTVRRGPGFPSVG